MNASLNLYDEYSGEDVTDDTVDGVVGAVMAAFCCAMYLRGEDGRRVRVKLAESGKPSTGELLRSVALGV